MSEKPKRRKIALFSTSFLSYSQTFIYDEIRSHSDRYQIEVFCKDRQNELRFPWENYHKPSGKIGEFLYENIAYWPTFSKIIKNGNFDLIHAHFGTSAIYALPYARKFNIPLIVTFHGNDVASLYGLKKYLPTKWRYNFLKNRLFETLDRALVVSNDLIELLKDLGCEPSKIKHFRLGIDLQNFSPAPNYNYETIQFLMIGRFTEKKGHIYALRAFNNLISEGVKAHLTLIGTGTLMQKCMNFVEQNDLKKHVTFSGEIPADQIPSHINNAHVLLAPSVVASDFDREGLPTVIKEAAACELPVISTYHAGIPELVISGKNGFLVQERSVDDLTEKMKFFVNNAEMINEMGAEGRKRVASHFDILNEINTLERHYEEVLKTKS